MTEIIILLRALDDGNNCCYKRSLSYEGGSVWSYLGCISVVDGEIVRFLKFWSLSLIFVHSGSITRLIDNFVGV